MHSELGAGVFDLPWKDRLQDAAWIVGVAVGLFTVAVGIYQLWANTKSRSADLRWRRVSGARDILAEIHHHDCASKAVMMLDWHGGEHAYEIAESRKEKISYENVLSGLKKEQSQCSDEISIYIRDCFDWFFYYVDRIEYYLQTQLICFEDIDSVFRPYARIIQKDWDVYESFMSACGYKMAAKFWKRYETRPQKSP